MNRLITHFYWYGYAATFFIGLDKLSPNSFADFIAAAIVALSSWGGVIATLIEVLS